MVRSMNVSSSTMISAIDKVLMSDLLSNHSFFDLRYSLTLRSRFVRRIPSSLSRRRMRKARRRE